jgi:hypothetical protein
LLSFAHRLICLISFALFTYRVSHKNVRPSNATAQKCALSRFGHEEARPEGG